MGKRTVTHLTTEELATRWRMQPETLRAWRSRGRGPRYRKVGSKVLYSLTEIERFEKRGEK